MKKFFWLPDNSSVYGSHPTLFIFRVDTLTEKKSKVLDLGVNSYILVFSGHDTLILGNIKKSISSGGRVVTVEGIEYTKDGKGF
jgi:hypothetical protein